MVRDLLPILIEQIEFWDQLQSEQSSSLVSMAGMDAHFTEWGTDQDLFEVKQAAFPNDAIECPSSLSKPGATRRDISMPWMD